MLEKIVLFPTETRESLQQILLSLNQLILLSLNQLVDHHFLRFRTTTQVIRELLRKSVARERVRFSRPICHPGEGAKAVFSCRKKRGCWWNESRQVQTKRDRRMTKDYPERSPMIRVGQSNKDVRDQVVRFYSGSLISISSVVQLIHQG